MNLTQDVFYLCHSVNLGQANWVAWLKQHSDSTWAVYNIEILSKANYHIWNPLHSYSTLFYLYVFDIFYFRYDDIPFKSRQYISFMAN